MSYVYTSKQFFTVVTVRYWKVSLLGMIQKPHSHSRIACKSSVRLLRLFLGDPARIERVLDAEPSDGS
ncbi:predicted protein [Plenodomus lingam JN3]|uniref:Predicted protein n=1 Tax=Leptosphaeria maculans (strain JN3 / isolate v23.1.3 / race Av1-4-5-6-7-8) TaxID=985895 RepID=E5ABE0_LEPMJ|nr:predicted protein [Plenodomus lingam JN3]CBY00981.1 predicted protein [Plenodomus lingam JN3]